MRAKTPFSLKPVALRDPVRRAVAGLDLEPQPLKRELYERLGILGRHVAKLGRSLDGAVCAYNEAVGSLESRVLVTARKFDAHGVPGDVPELVPIERQSRPLHALELTADGGADVLEIATDAASKDAA